MTLPQANPCLVTEEESGTNGLLICGECDKVTGQYEDRVYFGLKRGHLCSRCAIANGWLRDTKYCLVIWKDDEIQESQMQGSGERTKTA